MPRRLILLLCVLTAACAPVTQSPVRPFVTATVFRATSTPQPGQSPSPPATVTGSPSPTDDGAALKGQVEAVLAEHPAEWRILVKQVGGSVLYARQTTERVDTASVIKIPIALLFFKTVTPKSEAALNDYLVKKGIDGRTFGQLLRAMLVDSEEDATSSLWTAIGESHLDVGATLRSWGAAHTDITLRKSTVEDIAALLEGFYAGNLLTPAARQVLLDYLAEYTPADEMRLGVLRGALPCGGRFYNKRGTITKEYLLVADVAILAFPTRAGERVYLLALFASPGQEGATYESLVEGMEALARVFWGTIGARSGLAEAGCVGP